MQWSDWSSDVCSSDLYKCVHVQKLTWGNQRTTELSLAGKATVVAEKRSTRSALQVPFPHRYHIYHVDPLLGNGPYTYNREKRHVRVDVTQQWETYCKRCSLWVRSEAIWNDRLQSASECSAVEYSKFELNSVESPQLWDSRQPVRKWARKQRALLEAVSRQPVNTEQTEKT
jgi:hypothetical protein